MKERGQLESQGRGVCWHFECSLARLKHLAVAEHRQVQHGVGIHTLEEEGRVQLQQLGVALSADSFCVCWRKLSSGKLVLSLGLKQVLGKLSSGKLVLSLGLKQVLGKRGLQERGGVWGAVEQELGGREEGSLQRQGEAGR